MDRGELRGCPDCGATLKQGEKHDHEVFCRVCGWEFAQPGGDHHDNPGEHKQGNEEHATAHGTSHQGHSHGEHGLEVGAEGWWKSPQAMTTGLGGLLAISGLIMQLAHVSSAVTTPVFLAGMVSAGYWIAIEAVKSLKRFHLGINVLVIIATVGAVILGELFEAATLVFLFAVGEALEDYSLDRTRDSVRQLLDLAPQQARVISGSGDTVLQAAETVQPGEQVLVRPGDRLPLDGEVVSGESEVNQAPITGESTPVSKTVGDKVFAGTINQHGALVVRVTRGAGDTTLAQIVRLVERAQASRSESESFIDRFSRYYTPAVVGLAVLLWVVPPVAFGQPFEPWFYRGLVALLLGCPCALVISTPVSIVSGLTSAARSGGLIKGGVYLETLGAVRAVAFDKTGTLTSGQPAIIDVIPANGFTEADLVRFAAAAESRSEHHLATAILAEASDRDIDFPPVESFTAMAGKGVRAVISDRAYYVGAPALFHEDLKLPIDEGSILRQRAEQASRRGATVVYVGTETELLGAFAIADELRPEASTAIQALRKAGVENVVMLTGDNWTTARAVASELGIDEVHAELLPEDKVLLVNQLSRSYGKVAMVGDGINDAPALAAADVSIAMGAAGTDTALETADIALMADDLNGLPFMMRLSRYTLQKVRQNIWFAIGTKLLAALLILPGWLTLWMAVMADVGATVVVSINGMRLLNFRRGSP